VHLIDLQRQDDVFVITLRAGENRLDVGMLDALGRALDEVEGCEGPLALVTTGEGRFYSNGIDLDWLRRAPAEEAGAFLVALDRLLARLLTFPVATVAAINGHAFAAGAMIALAHDFRVMRLDRGSICLPQIDLGMPLRPGMVALTQARLSAVAAHEAIVTGRRYAGPDAMSRMIVDEVAPRDQVLSRALERAGSLANKHRGTLVALKRGLYVDVLSILESS